MNQTILKFGYPQGLIREYAHWVILLRPQQVTLGALILACKDEARAFSEISPTAFAELGQITGELETTLQALFDYDKINYLMLMMVDPDVHFHVIPRYGKTLDFQGQTFTDPGWPKTPDLGHTHPLSLERFDALKDTIVQQWHSLS